LVFPTKPTLKGVYYILFLIFGSRSDSQIPIPLPSSTLHEIISFDVDLNSKDAKILNLELGKLRFIVGLSMMIARYSPERYIQQYSNVMVIMKPEFASISDPSICYFTHNEIGRLNLIHSEPGAPTHNRYYTSQISGSLSTVGILNEESVKIWSENKFFYPITITEFRSVFGSEDDIF